MHRIVASISSLSQHQDTLAHDPARYRPDCCPRCGFGTLWRHGRYYRKADRAPHEGPHEPAAVPRFRCTGCGATCSRLPACVAPRRWYDWRVQQQALRALAVAGSVRAAARVAGIGRHTVRRWRDWLTQRGAVFAFHLASRFPDWARVPDLGAFWRETLVGRSLPEVMTVLDAYLTVP